MEGVEVAAVGCMAGCGSGPNVAMDPPGVILNHIATPARFSDAMQAVGGVDIPAELLKATELRLAGNAAARGGDLDAAVAKYTEVGKTRIVLHPAVKLMKTISSTPHVVTIPDGKC